METNSFAILYYIRNSRLDQQGRASILLRITVNTKRAEFSIKRKVKPESWNSIKVRMKGHSVKAKSLNHFIDQLESKAFNTHAKLIIKKKPFDAELIRRKLLNIEEAHKTLKASLFFKQLKNQPFTIRWKSRFSEVSIVY